MSCYILLNIINAMIPNCKNYIYISILSDEHSVRLPFGRIHLRMKGYMTLRIQQEN